MDFLRSTRVGCLVTLRRPPLRMYLYFVLSLVFPLSNLSSVVLGGRGEGSPIGAAVPVGGVAVVM